MVKKTAILLILFILCNALIFTFIWDDHTFVSGLNPFLAVVFLLLFLLIVLPLVIFSIRRVARYGKGRIRSSPATIFVLGFFIFLIGDFINELVFGSSTLDIQLKDTYFVIAHAHLMIFFALIFLAFSAVYFIYPGITGRTMNAPMGYIHFAVTLVTTYLLCWPGHYEGLAGMPRRYMDYTNWVSLDGTRPIIASCF